MEASDNVQHKNSTQETVVCGLEPPHDTWRSRALHLTVATEVLALLSLSIDTGFQNDSNMSLRKTKNIDVC